MGGVIMDHKQLDKRFHLDEEIRELVQFANSMYGDDGIRYLQKELDRIVTSIDSNELPTTKI